MFSLPSLVAFGIVWGVGVLSFGFWVFLGAWGLWFFQKTTQRLHFKSQIKPINILLNIEEYYFSYY